MSSEKLDKKISGKSSKSGIVLVLFLLLAGTAAFVLLKLYEREKPLINLNAGQTILGHKQDLSFTVTDARSGIRRISVFLRQQEKSIELDGRRLVRRGYFGDAGPHRLEETVTIEPRRLGFADGPAELEITARDFSLWNWAAGNQGTRTYRVTIDTRPPRPLIREAPRYILPGGSGIIIYELDEAVEKHGVEINDHFHPGFPLGGENRELSVAYIGLPYDTEQVAQSSVIAVDRAGNTGRASFGLILKTARQRRDRITVSDNFLNRKLPEFAQRFPELGGSPLEQYLFVNRELRGDNNRTIARLCGSPEPVRLWEGRFERMSRSSRRAGFADHRTYFYQDREIDQQVHLGIDLASVRNAPVTAANRGKVVFADYLGIYGNTVILDHGQGLFSLYAHLSRLDVRKGDAADKDTILGLSGTSGMAGGDHLHFSMLVNGVFVTPLEWWDDNWLRLNIEGPLTSATAGRALPE